MSNDIIPTTAISTAITEVLGSKINNMEKSLIKNVSSKNIVVKKMSVHNYNSSTQSNDNRTNNEVSNVTNNNEEIRLDSFNDITREFDGFNNNLTFLLSDIASIDKSMMKNIQNDSVFQDEFKDLTDVLADISKIDENSMTPEEYDSLMNKHMMFLNDSVGEMSGTLEKQLNFEVDKKRDEDLKKKNGGVEKKSIKERVTEKRANKVENIKEGISNIPIIAGMMAIPSIISAIGTLPALVASIGGIATTVGGVVGGALVSLPGLVATAVAGVVVGGVAAPILAERRKKEVEKWQNDENFDENLVAQAIENEFIMNSVEDRKKAMELFKESHTATKLKNEWEEKNLKMLESFDGKKLNEDQENKQLELIVEYEKLKKNIRNAGKSLSDLDGDLNNKTLKDLYSVSADITELSKQKNLSKEDELKLEKLKTKKRDLEFRATFEKKTDASTSEITEAIDYIKGLKGNLGNQKEADELNKILGTDNTFSEDTFSSQDLLRLKVSRNKNSSSSALGTVGDSESITESENTVKRTREAGKQELSRMENIKRLEIEGKQKLFELMKRNNTLNKKPMSFDEQQTWIGEYVNKHNVNKLKVDNKAIGGKLSQDNTIVGENGAEILDKQGNVLSPLNTQHNDKLTDIIKSAMENINVNSNNGNMESLMKQQNTLLSQILQKNNQGNNTINNNTNVNNTNVAVKPRNGNRFSNL